jgi:hypothetical protein
MLDFNGSGFCLWNDRNDEVVVRIRGKVNIICTAKDALAPTTVMLDSTEGVDFDIFGTAEEILTCPQGHCA